MFVGGMVVITVGVVFVTFMALTGSTWSVGALVTGLSVIDVAVHAGFEALTAAVACWCFSGRSDTAWSALNSASVASRLRCSFWIE